MSEPQKKLFLLDAYALIYRAHFAFTKTPRINSRGRNTSVPFGFTNTLLEVLQKQKPTHIGVAFDTSAPTFRDEIFPEYKANRQETPEDIRYGTPVVKEILRGFSIPILELDGFEADDIIGTLAVKAEQAGFEVYMMTPDKDYGQLVTDKIKLFKPAYMGNSFDILGPAEVCERWDISSVSQVIDILGLQGDTSDNIPGIPGFGPKTAATLLKAYGSVENIIAHAGELKGKQKELLETYKDQALLSKQLATINLNVPVDFSEEGLLYSGPDKEILKPIFEELEFKTIAARVFSEASPVAKSSQGPQLNMFAAASAEVPVATRQIDLATVAYRELVTDEDLQSFVTLLKDQSRIGIHLETSESGTEGNLRTFVVSWKEGEAWFLTGRQIKLISTDLAKIFSTNSLLVASYNLKPALVALSREGINLRCKLQDILIAHYLLEPEGSHDIGLLAEQFLGYTLINGLTTSDLQRQCELADIMLPLMDKLRLELETRRQYKLFMDTEMALVPVLGAMENEGVRVDPTVLAQMSTELNKEAELVQKEIYSLAGMEFNIGSPRQLGEVLFEKLKLIEKPKKTKTGQYATGEDVLMGLITKHDIIRKIIEFREVEKLRSTYVDALPKMVSKMDHRIHTDYRQAVAATGRLSSNNPNLQNIPIRTTRGRLIRKAFVSRSDEYVFMSADYSQIELRIAASFAKDQTMIEAFRNKRDIHTTTAGKVFKVDISEVTSDMRRKAKEVNFGILYGSTAFGLSQNLGISRSEAAEIIKSYFEEFPAIKQYMDDAINIAREKEYVETILGRRRYLRDINSRNITTRGFAERNAINAPIQGSAADIIKIAMIFIHNWIQKSNLKSRMIMQVHDELVFDVHRDEVDLMRNQIGFLMKSAVALDVPMEVEIGIGDNWLEAH